MTTENPAAPAAEAPATAEAPKAGATTAVPDSEGLDAGFKKVRGDEPTTEARPTKPDAIVETPAAGTPEAEVEATTEPVVFGGLTEPQLKAALAKAGEVDEIKESLTATRKDALGRIGQLQQAVKDLQKAPAPGQSIKVTKDLLKRLNTDGYEELADALAEDLSSILQAPAGSAPVDVDAIVKTATGTLNRDLHKTLLTLQHEDWPEIWGRDDFKLWQGTLPADVRQQLGNSWDSVYLNKALTAFKAWKANGKKQPEVVEDPVAAASAKEAKEAKEKRLAGGVTPKTGAPPGPSRLPDAAGLSAGFERIRGKA